MNKAIAIGICLVFIGIILIYPSQDYIAKPSYFSPPELSILSKFDNETLQSTGRNEYIIELRTPTGIKALEEQNKIVSVLESYGGIVKSRFTVVNAIEAEIDAENITKIAEVEYVKRIYLDRNIAKITTIKTLSTDGFEIGRLFGSNYTGNGVVIAVVDTGINSELDEFKDKVIDTFSITGENYTHWHGTAVASVIVSVAPDVKLLNVMVFQPDGSAYLSDILKGFDYIQRWHRSHIDVPLIVSNSWGISQEGWNCGGWKSPCVICEAVNSLTKQGIAVVNAGGNDGAVHNAINCPGQAYYALCVASVDENYNWSWFSSVGPTTDGNRKPDVAEVGENVVVLDVSGRTKVASGTSFATPIVSALLALLMEKYGDKLSVEEYYDLIRENTVDVEEKGYDYKTGYGVPNASIDVYVAEVSYDVKSYAGYASMFLGFICIGIGVTHERKRR